MGIFSTPGAPAAPDIVAAGITNPMAAGYQSNYSLYYVGMQNFWRGKMGFSPQQVADTLATMTAQTGLTPVQIMAAASGLRDFLNDLGAGLSTAIPGAIYTVAAVLSEDGKTIVTPAFEYEDVPQVVTANSDGTLTITTPPQTTPVPTTPPLNTDGSVKIPSFT